MIRLFRLSQLPISPVNVEDTLQEVVLVQLNRDDEMGLNIHELGNPAHNETEDHSSNLDQNFRADIQVSRFMVIQQLSSGPSLNFPNSSSNRKLIVCLIKMPKSV